MRKLLWIALLLSQCAPVPEDGKGYPKPSAATAAIPKPSLGLPGIEPEEAPATSHATSPARFIGRHINGIHFEGVGFDSRSHHLAIADQSGGPASRYANAAAAAKAHGAIASLNGGFFDPDGRPLGVVVSRSEVTGAWNTASSLCSGTYLQDAAGRMAIHSRQTTQWPVANPHQELLQAGPMLIRDGLKVGGLNRDKKASRSLLIWDGANQWWMGRTGECSLEQLAEALALRSPAGWKVRQALNLDGGSSCELWISTRVQGGPKHSSHWWLKPARNYLVLLTRKSP